MAIAAEVVQRDVMRPPEGAKGGDAEYEHSARLQDAERFGDCTAIVFDVLENVESNDGLEGIVLERQRRGVREDEVVQVALAALSQGQVREVRTDGPAEFFCFLEDGTGSAADVEERKSVRGIDILFEQIER